MLSRYLPPFVTMVIWDYDEHMSKPYNNYQGVILISWIAFKAIHSVIIKLQIWSIAILTHAFFTLIIPVLIQCTHTCTICHRTPRRGLKMVDIIMFLWQKILTQLYLHWGFEVATIRSYSKVSAGHSINLQVQHLKTDKIDSVNCLACPLLRSENNESWFWHDSLLPKDN